MNVDLPAGKYVVAVSGGVDSVVLLHLLAQKQNIERRKKNGEGDSSFAVRRSPFSLVVAHFDHGIREDSAEDRKLVQELAEGYGLPFEYAEGKLRAGASEALAREARYAFLRQVREKYGADAIVTAHHQDDVLETAILNLLRGPSRRGFASLRSTDEIKRPLLDIPKKELLRYAEGAGLRWREDSTNADPKYLRNYVRLHILPRFAEADREVLLGLVQRMARLNSELDAELARYLLANEETIRLCRTDNGLDPRRMFTLNLDQGGSDERETLDRPSFMLLTHAEAREVLAYWLREQAGVELSKQLLERLVVAAKTGRSGSKVDVDGQHWLLITKEHLHLQPK